MEDFVRLFHLVKLNVTVKMDSGENFAKMVRTSKESFLACIDQDMIVVNTYQISEKVLNINDYSILMLKIKINFR